MKQDLVFNVLLIAFFLTLVELSFLNYIATGLGHVRAELVNVHKEVVETKSMIEDMVTEDANMHPYSTKTYKDRLKCIAYTLKDI